MATIGDAVPAPTDPYTYRTIVQDRFLYALNIDTDSWDTWTAKVDEPETYNVLDEHTLTKNKFSPFLLSLQCMADAEDDGCCLRSEHGAICMIIPNGGDGTSINFYRMSKEHFNEEFALFSSTNLPITTSIQTDSNSRGYAVVAGADNTFTADNTDDKYLNYFDQMNCVQQTDNFKFTCEGWQVDWKDGDETDGYSRYGLDETINGTFIDASSDTAATLTRVSFKGAASIAATITGIAAALMLSF